MKNLKKKDPPFTELEKKIILSMIIQLDAKFNGNELVNVRFEIPVSAFGCEYGFDDIKIAIKNLNSHICKISGIGDYIPAPLVGITDGILQVKINEPFFIHLINLKKVIHKYIFDLQTIIDLEVPDAVELVEIDKPVGGNVFTKRFFFKEKDVNSEDES
jgi:hypothetical protein